MDQLSAVAFAVSLVGGVHDLAQRQARERHHGNEAGGNGPKPV